MSLLGMGLTGALMILVIVAVRGILHHRLPKATFVVLWLLVAARLLMPASIPFSWNAYALVGLIAPGAAASLSSALGVAPTSNVKTSEVEPEATLGAQTEPRISDVHARDDMGQGGSTSGMSTTAPELMAGAPEGTTAHVNGSDGALDSGSPALNGTTAHVNESDTASESGSPALNGTTAQLNEDAGALNPDLSALNDEANALNSALPELNDAIGATGAWLARATGVPLVPAAIWAAGSLVCAGCFALSYARSRRRFADALPVEDGALLAMLHEVTLGLRRPVRLRSSDRIDTPLTYGVLRSTVLVPKGMACSTDSLEGSGSLLFAGVPGNADPLTGRDCARFVLEHEAAHIRRFDLVKKVVLAAALCLHWANPLVWAMWLLANRDIELACDEAVVRRLGLTARSSYARTLIGMEETRGALAPLYSAFNTGALEERIVAIMKVKKLSAAAVLASSLLIVGVPAALATTYAVGTDEGTAIISSRPSVQADRNGEATPSSSHDGGSTTPLPRHANDASASDGADARPSLAAPNEGPYANEAARAGRADELTERLLTSYEAFGLSWGYSRNASYYDDSPWRLLMEYEGKDVCSVYDKLHNVWIAASLGTTLRANGGIDLMATYDADGTLTGLTECDVELSADNAAGDSAHADASATRDRSSATSDRGRTGIFFASASDGAVSHLSSSAGAAEWSSTEVSSSQVTSDASTAADAIHEEGVSYRTSEAAASFASDAAFDAQEGGELSEADLRELRAWYAQFEPYGLIYDAANGSLIYRAGDARIPVRQFVDEEGEGRLSMYTDYDVTDGIKLRTVRDANGHLTGLEEFAGEYVVG